MPLCLCGCGRNVTKITNKYIQGHAIRDKVRSVEHRRKVAESARMLGLSWKGKKHSPETIEKMRQSSLGQPGPNKGKTFSEESKEKMRKSAIGNQRAKGYKCSEKRKKEMSEFCKKNNPMKDPVIAKKISELKKGVPRSKETRRKIRIAQIEHIQNQYKEYGVLHPTIGKLEGPVLDELESIIGEKIIRNQLIEGLGYFPDGYVPSLNIVIEFYEPFHNDQVEKDLERKLDIINELDCLFFEIKQEDWEINKQNVISDLKKVISELKDD